MILNGITKAFSLDRKELLNVKTQNMKNVIPYVSLHNPQNLEIYNVIRNIYLLWKRTTHKSSKVKDCPNLKTILTREFFSQSNSRNSPLSRHATNLDAIHVLISQNDCL